MYQQNQYSAVRGEFPLAGSRHRLSCWMTILSLSGLPDHE
jgi:hypothetical protein